MTNTSQSGVPMTASKGTESFSQHPYAPSAPASEFMTGGNTPNFNDLFCVQREKTVFTKQETAEYPTVSDILQMFI